MSKGLDCGLVHIIQILAWNSIILHLNQAACIQNISREELAI